MTQVDWKPYNYSTLVEEKMRRDRKRIQAIIAEVDRNSRPGKNRQMIVTAVLEKARAKGIPQHITEMILKEFGLL